MSSGCSGTSAIVPEPSRSSIIFRFSCISPRLCQIPNLKSMLRVLRVAAFRKCILAGRISIPTGKSRLGTMASQNFELLSKSHDVKLPLVFGRGAFIDLHFIPPKVCFSTSHELAPLFCFLLTDAISASCQSNGNSSSQSSYSTALCLSRVLYTHYPYNGTYL